MLPFPKTHINITIQFKIFSQIVEGKNQKKKTQQQQQQKTLI
jgi:hypothetical protein